MDPEFGEQSIAIPNFVPSITKIAAPIPEICASRAVRHESRMGPPSGAATTIETSSFSWLSGMVMAGYQQPHRDACNYVTREASSDGHKVCRDSMTSAEFAIPLCSLSGWVKLCREWLIPWPVLPSQVGLRRR